MIKNVSTLKPSRAVKESSNYKKMDPITKNFWIFALRSGKFTQGNTFLKKNENGKFKHCCLGVLGEICGVKEEKSEHSPYYDFVFSKRNKKEYFLKAGFQNLSSSVQKKLAELNDTNKFSFDEIADWIELNL